jgi:coenzyme F420-reducing hydrogenase alpha subunit
MLHVPDFLGYDSALALARDYPDEVNRGLRLKKHGNQLLDILGGRAVHPINVAVGGFYRLPRREELAKLIPDFEWALQAAIDAAHWVARFDFPQFEQPYDFVAVSHPDEYAMCEGPIRTSDGLDVGADRFEKHFREQQVPHSTALQAVRIGTGRTYFLGPLARINLNREQLLPTARRLADEVGLEHPCRNVFKSIIARSIEIVQAYDEALSILKSYRPAKESRIKYEQKQGGGAAATEAPRGLLYHRYAIDDDGLVTAANIVPPTSQNQSQIESDLREYLPAILSLPDHEVAQACERLVRSYDPCISCSTHFLKVTLDRGS